MIRRFRGRRVAAVLLAALASLALPLAASAHSELETSSPADKSTVAGTPDEILLTFSETLNPKKSSILLLDSRGAQVAKAGVDLTDDTVMRLAPPTLEAGGYEIDWTSVALDGDLLRGKVTFTVTAPTPSPTVVPTATASSAATIAPTTNPTASPSASASAVASPAPAPASASGADVIVPVLVAIVLIAVLGAILLRGRSGGGAR
jgi:methionine-rich copper-binding protein CopC